MTIRYLPELYYLQDSKDFPFRQAVMVTAVTIAQWSARFYAKLLVPKSKQGVQERSGALPKGMQERESFVVGLVEWLFESSAIDELFCLLLDSEPIPNPTKVAKFDHHDDTCCWVLNLTEEEFAQLQSSWVDHGLPEDLFYPEHLGLCMPRPGTSLKARLFRLLGVQKCYTPKQWENAR